MTDYISLIGMGAAFLLGGLIASQHYEREILDIRLEYSQTVEKQLEQNAKKERESAAKIITVTDEKDQALADLAARERTVRALLDSLRDASPSTLPAAKSDSCKSEHRAVAKCKGLLRESAELLAEASEKLERNAVNHDALAKLVGK